jgi:hypothetical protein
MPDERASYEVKGHESHEGAPCADCGAFERTVWGAVKKDGEAFAVYYARWQINHRERGLKVLVSVGGWGMAEDEKDRRALAFDCQMGDKRPTFEPIDAATLAWSEKALLGQKLSKAEAAALPEVEAEARAIAEKIVQHDERVRAFVTRGGRETRDASSYIEQAFTKLNSSDDVGAEVEATKAIGYDPEAWEAYFLRGWARVRAEQFADGIADLEKYLARAAKGKHAPRAQKILKLARSKRTG